jgi:hypothetical protein
MARRWLIVIVALLLAWPGGAAAADPLVGRLADWPDWHLPAPLPRPRGGDLLYPDWFAGGWQVEDSEGHTYRVRFHRRGDGAVVGERAANAFAVGRAVLGEQLQAVQDDPADPNRQLARLADDGLLDGRVVGRSSATPGPDLFVADELSLQVLHRPGRPPRLSRVETLSRYEHLADGTIRGLQRQAVYPSPEAGLRVAASSSHTATLLLVPLPQSGEPPATSDATAAYQRG